MKINDIICADSKNFLSEFRDNSIGLIVTDLPYESLDKHRNMDAPNPRLVDWFPTIKNDDFESILYHFYRILKDDTHCYIFVDDETSDIIKTFAIKAGFKVWKRIVWDKVNIGMGYHYRAQYEFILFLEKGKRNLNDASISDVLRIKKVHDGYPTEKPVELYDIFILNSSDENNVILDPFAGSGVLAESAIKNNRRYICIDIKEEACSYAKNRINNVVDKIENQETFDKWM